MGAGHAWPDRRLANCALGETDCCFRCHTTRTVVKLEGGGRGYRYNYPAGYSPLRR